MILEDKIKNENGQKNKDHLKNLDKLKNEDQPKYMFNIHNLRLSGTANLELSIAQQKMIFLMEWKDFVQFRLVVIQMLHFVSNPTFCRYFSLLTAINLSLE